MNNIPKIAILMAAYNGSKWIKEQIDSILCQENIAVTLYISIDLSFDGSYELVQELALVYKNIIVLPYGERFGGAAKNFYRLIKDVDFTGFYCIAFADQDDIWSLDKLSHGISQMELANAEAYSASVIAFWDDGPEKLIDKSQPQREFDYLFEAAGPGCTYIFTNKAASLIKSYLNNFPELNDFVLHDWLSYAILRHSHYKWIIDSEPKMKYRQHSANQVGANTSLKGIIYRIKYILSGEVFKSIALLVNVLGISSVNLSSRLGVLKLAFKARQLRRRGIDQAFAFVALILYAVKGPEK